MEEYHAEIYSPAALYLLAIMEMRTMVKTMVPATPPTVIPRMFPWTCLDWHLSPVKKKACPDGHLGKQSTDLHGSGGFSCPIGPPQGPHTHCPGWAVPIRGVHVTTSPLGLEAIHIPWKHHRTRFLCLPLWLLVETSHCSEVFCSYCSLKT